MRERYVNILAALRERYVGASIALRDKANCCQSAIAEIQNIPTRAYFPFKLCV